MNLIINSMLLCDKMFEKSDKVYSLNFLEWSLHSKNWVTGQFTLTRVIWPVTQFFECKLHSKKFREYVI